MNSLTLIDATLRQLGTQPVAPLNFKEQVEVARQADLLRLDLVETAPLVHGRADVLFLHTIAPLLSHAGLSVPVSPDPAAIRAAWDALRDAPRSQINIRVPVSTVQMEYLFHKKAPAMLATIAACAAAARDAGAAFEISLVDATRAEPAFLDQAARVAAEGGTVAVTLCDDAGEMLPDEFAAFAAHVRGILPETVALGVECSDALGLGAAAATACLRAGATRLRMATAVGDDLPPTISVGRLLRRKGDALGVCAAIDFTVLEKAIRMVELLCDAESNPTAAAESARAVGGTPAEHLSLRAGATEAEVAAAVARIGYDLDPADEKHVFDEFNRIAARKDALSSKDLDAIVAAAALQVPETYSLNRFVITCGNTVASMASVLLVKDGKEVAGNAVGNGPIDAAFHSIEDIVGRHFELDDFQIQTVTEGRAAMGTAIVKLRSDGGLYSGKGVSTDIVGAAIRAYIDALNKICYDERA